MKISPDWSVFDRIFCMHYLPYRERMPRLERELGRVGILDSGRFEYVYTFPSKAFDMLYSSLLEHGVIFDEPSGSREFGNFKNEKVFNLAMNHMNCVKKAYLLGYRRILMLEDDVAFLNDVGRIAEYIANIPEDMDFVNFDYWFRYMNKDRYVDGSRMYSKLDMDANVVNMSCLAMSRRGMKYWLSSMDNFLKCSDIYINQMRTYSLGMPNVYVPDINIAVQSDAYTDANNCVNTRDGRNGSVVWQYGTMNLRLDDYGI